MIIQKPNLIIKEKRAYPHTKWSIKKQRFIASDLVYQVTQKKLEHRSTGRPCVNAPVDISLSHKDTYVVVACIDEPFHIGIDIEKLDVDLNTKCFLRSSIRDDEQFFFQQFCEARNISDTVGLIIFWSLKESFFKCIDYALKSIQLSIVNISNDGDVSFDYSEEVRFFLETQSLFFHSAYCSLQGEWVFSQTIMIKQ